MDPLARRRPPSAQKETSKELRPKLSSISSAPAEAAVETAPESGSFVERRSSAPIRRNSFISIALGSVGLVLWLVPWAGFLVSFFGLIQGIRARSRGQRAARIALVGISLCALAMSLAVANWVVGAYLGGSGKNMFTGILFP